MNNSFGCRATLDIDGHEYTYFSLPKLEGTDTLPFALKILLENLLRLEDGVDVTRDDIEAFLRWDPQAAPSQEIAFTPARVLMQDFTGVPRDRRPRRDA